jgi:hypothetical protein
MQFPSEAAETLRIVRNALVHLDVEALEKDLGNGRTVREYINTRDTVRTALVQAVDFVSGAYYYLREREPH